MTTIGREVELSGIGIHGGRRVNLRMRPCPGSGFIFRRSDLDGLEFPFSARNLESGRRTVLRLGPHRIQTVEHLLAAALASGISGLLIEIDGDEVPIFDGSALPFVKALDSAGRSGLEKPGGEPRLLRPFTVEDGPASISVQPADEFRISYTIHFDHPAIGTQSLSVAVTRKSFAREIAPARTFGFLSDMPELESRGLARGGSLDNAVVLDEKGVMNGPLRFPDEFVRHKILDLIGDLALLGGMPRAHFIAERAGHAVHQAAARFWLDHPEYGGTTRRSG